MLGYAVRPEASAGSERRPAGIEPSAQYVAADTFESQVTLAIAHDFRVQVAFAQIILRFHELRGESAGFVAGEIAAVQQADSHGLTMRPLPEETSHCANQLTSIIGKIQQPQQGHHRFAVGFIPLALGDVGTGAAVPQERALVVENRDPIARYPNCPAAPGPHGILQSAETFPSCHLLEGRRLERLSSFLGMNVVEVLLADKFLRPIAPDRLRYPAQIVVQPVRIDFPNDRPALLGERIVSVVCLFNLFPGLVPGGHIAHNSDCLPSLSLLDGAQGELHGELNTILSPRGHLHHLAEARPLSGRLKGTKVRMKVRRLARRYHKIMDRLARHFGRRVTEHPFRGGIAEDCPAFFVDHYDGVQGAIAKLSQRRLTLAEGALSALALPPVIGIPDFALHGRRQACQVSFDQVVVRARLHHRDRNIFPNSARNYDEREIQPGIVQNLEGFGSIKIRQLVIGNDHLPGLASEGGAHGVRIFHPLGVHVVPGLPQKAHDERGIALGILYLKYTQDLVHSNDLLTTGGCSFSTSQ